MFSTGNSSVTFKKWCFFTFLTKDDVEWQSVAKDTDKNRDPDQSRGLTYDLWVPVNQLAHIIQSHKMTFSVGLPI